MNEPAKDLRNEDRSAKAEARVNELLSDLKKDPLSTRLEEEASELVKALAKPLISEVARENEPVRDLKNV